MTIVAWAALVLSLIANVILFVNSFNKEADEEHINNIVQGVCNMYHDTMSMVRIMTNYMETLEQRIKKLEEEVKKGENNG